MKRVLKNARAWWLVAMLFAAGWTGCGRAPDDVRESRNRHMRRALAAKQSQDIDGAIAWCQRALERRPNLALAHRELGLMLDNYREDFVGAIYHYRRYLELRPDSPNREAVEELIRHCHGSLVAQVGERPSEWQRDLQDRNARIRVLETELAMWRAGGSAPAAPAQSPPARKDVSPSPPEAPPAQASTQTHVVRAGETLGTISSRYYGTPAKWNRIFEANRERIANANNLRVGTTLVIPAE